MDLKFGLDVTNKTLLAPDGQSLTIPPLFQGDDISISLQGMERLQNGDYLKVPIDFSRIKIGIGLVDAPPMAGTFCLQVEGEKTEVLPHNASKESIAEKLNALPSVTQRGGIRVLPRVLPIFISWHGKSRRSRPRSRWSTRSFSRIASRASTSGPKPTEWSSSSSCSKLRLHSRMPFPCLWRRRSMWCASGREPELVTRSNASTSREMPRVSFPSPGTG